MSKFKYFIGVGGQAQGPLHLEEIAKKIGEGSLDRNDWVWWPTQPAWLPLWTIYPAGISISTTPPSPPPAEIPPAK